MPLQFGVTVPFFPFELTLDLTLRAERAGLDSVLVPDHLVGTRSREALEAWSLLSVLAMKTSRVRLASAVTDPFRRHVAVLAQTAATVDVVSHGRLTLGIGAGEAMNLLPYGIEIVRPVERLRETVWLLKKLWTEEEVQARGKFYRLIGASVRPKPFQKPHPPVWIAANSPRSLRVAGELGDGWIPFLLTPEQFRDDLNYIKEVASSLNRSLDSFEPCLNIPIVLDVDGKRAVRAGSSLAKIYLAMKPKELEKLGFGTYARWDLDWSKHVHTAEGDRFLADAAEKIPQEAVDLVTILGKPDDAIDKIEDFLRAGAKHIIAIPLGDAETIKRTLGHFSREVAGYFRDKPA